MIKRVALFLVLSLFFSLSAFAKLKPPAALDLTKIGRDSSYVPDVGTSSINGGDMDMPLLSGESVTEGQWVAITSQRFVNNAPFYVTFVKPDVKRKYSFVNMVAMPTSAYKVVTVPGKEKINNPVANMVSPGRIPEEVIRQNLVAAFNGGFQVGHGKFGIIFNKVPLLNPIEKLGTILTLEDGQTLVGSWGVSSYMKNFDISKMPYKLDGKVIVSLRQNLLPLVEDGQITNTALNYINGGGGYQSACSECPHASDDSFANPRTGIGMTADGYIIYAAGNLVTPLALANAFYAAGCVSAMMLDINGWWHMRYFIVNNPPGEWDGTSNGLERLWLFREMHNLKAKDMAADISVRYIKPFLRDFMYVVPRSE